MSTTIPPDPASTLRELESRQSDNITVQLFWDPSTNATLVRVTDGRTGISQDVTVPAGISPLDVFHHPYAYAGEAV